MYGVFIRFDVDAKTENQAEEIVERILLSIKKPNELLRWETYEIEEG